MKRVALVLSIGLLGGCASPDYKSALHVPRNDCNNKLIHIEQLERELSFTRPILGFQKEHNERIFALKDTLWALRYNCQPA